MIGIFDSGFGGLSIFKEIYKLLPEYNYIYLGDSARAPYGNRSQENIYKFTEQAVDFLFKEGCELIIVACGTASAEALRKIQQKYLVKNHPNRRVLGIIRPLSEEAIAKTRFGKIGVAGTRSTVASQAYIKEINKLKNKKQKIEIHQKACPLLVPLVEEDWIKKPETKMILKKYLRPLKEKMIDTLILGCTHYPLLSKQFKSVMGKRVNILDSGSIVAKSLQDYLSRHPEIESKIKKKAKKIFYTTDDPKRFDELGGKFFGQKIKSKKIELK